MWERIKHILIKEITQIRRDKRMRFIILVAPLIQLIVFGYVVTTDVNHIPTAVVDLDHTQNNLSRYLIFELFLYMEIQKTGVSNRNYLHQVGIFPRRH